MKRYLLLLVMIFMLGMIASVLNAFEVTIGAGDQQARVPVDMLWKNSLFECLYFQDELGFVSGTINGVKFYNNFVTNLPNKPINIWLGTTTQTSFSENGWIPSGQLTQVFTGLVSFPAGANIINIIFTSPFIYTGGTLVMMVNRPMDTTYFSSQNYFLAQTTGSSRALKLQSDMTNYNPASPPATNATLSGQFPKTTFLFETEGMGYLQGTITSSGTPIAGATVSVASSNLTTTTEANGTYIFLGIPEGTQTVSVTKHGYNVVTHNVTIVEDQTTTQNFVIAPLAQITLTGRIVGIDNPAVGLSGAQISLSGFEPYFATTNASGQFTIENVYTNQTYQYLVNYNGYADTPGEVVVGYTNMNMGDVVVNEFPFPPNTVVATEAADYSNVMITWNEPGTGVDAWLHYDAGGYNHNIGTGGALDCDVAIRYPASVMQYYSGTSLNAVKVWPAQAGTFSIRVWTGGTPNAPGYLVVDQVFTPTLGTYNTIFLNTPVPIIGTEELWFGYRCIATSGYPLGADGGPAINGFGNMMYYQGAWTTLLALAHDRNYNWKIQGYVGYGTPTRMSQLTPLPFNSDRYNDGSLSADGMKKSFAIATADPSATTRTPHGYKIWRLAEGQEGNPNEWIELTNDCITDVTFSDSDWLTCEYNVPYKWVVKAVYTGYAGDTYSQPTFSNPIYGHGSPPLVVQAAVPISILMNQSTLSSPVDTMFSSNYPLSYELYGYSYLVASLNVDKTISITPYDEWFGVDYITIRATDPIGRYVETSLKVTVYQTGTYTEDFDHAGNIPAGWTITHGGTTDYPWQPVLGEGNDYEMKTITDIGKTANERMTSQAYDLSSYQDIVVSFSTNFLPYGSGTGTFAYTLNNVTYTVVETYSTATNGLKTYTLPNLDGKPSVKFRWIYANSSANTGQDNHWIVDDFSIFGVVPDTQAPSAVNGLTLSSQTSSTASLSWQASSDLYFGRYELYISIDDQVTTTDQLWSEVQDPALYNVDTIQSTITGLTTGNYWIAIRAVDQSNNPSALSDPVFVHIDGAVPIISVPIPGLQPEPPWVNSRTAEIGCSISDFNLIDPNSLNYRIDANGNGIYDDSEAWIAVPQTGRLIRNRDELTLLFDVTYAADGVLAFEIRATDFYGNIGYSGLSSQEGISDDWVVRIDSSAPVISSPVPVNQPEPEWQQIQTVQIGCMVEDLNSITTIEYRFDNNGNDVYDPEEAWQSYPLSRTGNRDMLMVEVPVEFAVDGIRRFEFRATDMLGNVSYSGASGLEGIEDDWVVSMDTTAPTFSDPTPANQPDPVWATLLEVEIGATIYDHNDIDAGSILYRVDLNGNRIYDPEEEWTPLILRSGANRNSLPFSTIITVPAGGIYAFEFKAGDTLGNVGYSGMSGVNGIEDDWMVKVDTHPPFFSLPNPGDQPLPLWSNNYSVTIGTTILDSLAVDMGNVQYRYDQNRNGIYDVDEAWQNLSLIRDRSARSVEVQIEVPLLLSADGVYKFEFKASDPNEVTGYSGMSQLQGIDDDWIFRIDTVPPTAISNFFAQDVTDYSIQLTWTASADVNFLGYRIHYSTSSDVSTADPYWDWNNDPNLSNAGTGLVSTVLTGLYPATRYYLMILATDEVGWVTQYPQIITAMTTSSAEPEAPENITISIVDGLLILNWDDVTQDVLGNPIIPSYYEVFVGDYPDFICDFDSLIATVNESYLELDDVVDYADRLFFKVVANIGMIRNSK